MGDMVQAIALRLDQNGVPRKELGFGIGLGDRMIMSLMSYAFVDGKVIILSRLNRKRTTLVVEGPRHT